MTAYAAYRPERILVMAPAAAIGRVEEQWSKFAGNSADTASITSIGNVANVDLPALVLLKMIVDRRLIESGLWNEVQVEIKAAFGSTMAIRGNEIGRNRALGWIREIAADTPSPEVIVWAREAAVHHLHEMMPDLQSLIWQRDRLAVMGDIFTISATHVQDVARIYFQ
jgi:hypothetical protein